MNPEKQLPNDEETILLIKDDPLTLILRLPDGCDPGRWEAAEAFTESIGRLKELYKGRKFQLLPFSYESTHGLKAILAVAD